MAEQTSRHARVIAFIDMGTNSVRLLLARVFPDRTYTILNRRKEVIRLGEGEFPAGRIQPEAMQRTVLVLRHFVEMAHSSGADEIIAVATSATRDASNQAEFLHLLEQEDQLHMHVISGKEEARLIYRGVAGSMNLNARRAVFIDIGGGSTEVIVGNQSDYQYLDSLELGAIRLTMLFLNGETGPVTPEKYALIQNYVRDTAVRAIQAVCQEKVSLGVGSSGTIENLADIACYQFNNRRRTPDDTLSLKHLNKVVQTLCKLPLEERRKVPGINPERADIIIAGAAILETLMDEMDLKELLISDRGLQDGLLYETLDRLGSSGGYAELSVRERSVLRLGRSLDFDETHAHQVARLAVELFDQARAAGLHTMGEWERELLGYAGLLHDIGIALSYSDHNAHSAYFIRNAELLGFDQTEVEIMAATVRYHRKAYPSKKDPEFAVLDTPQREVVGELSVFLSIAESLDRTHQQAIEHVHLNVDGKRRVRLLVEAGKPVPLELWGVDYHKKAFLKVFGKKLEI